MPRGYKRNWFAVEASILDNEKWMSLTFDEKGKWLTVRALAERQPTGDFKSAGYLSALLGKEGDSEGPVTVARLIEVRLLDACDDGRVSVHDIDDYQPETSTERVQRLRNGPKRTETASNTTYRQTDIQHARPPVTGAGARERTDGETLKQYLDRIGAPIPDVAVKEETTNGKANGTQGSGDPDVKSRRGPRRSRAKTV